MDRPRRRTSRLAALWQDAGARTALIFAVIAGLWVVASDIALLALLGADAARMASVQTAKGLGFILLSAGMIFLLVRQATRRRERVQEALDRTRARFDLIVEGIHDYSIFMLDAAGRIVSWNRGAELITGYGAEEVRGQPMEHLYLPEDRAAGLPERLLDQARSQGRVADRGWRLAKGGRPFLADIVITALRDAEGRIEAFVSFARDVTEQQAVADQLRKAQERLTLALEAGQVGLWDLDLVANTMHVSPEWKAQLGYADHELATHSRLFMERLHPDDRAALEAKRAAALSGRTPHFDLELRLRHRDGSWRWIHSRGRLLRDAEGRPSRMIGVHTDVTERRQTEAQLRQALRMEAIGQLTGGVAHDFNNLLTVVLGNAEFLVDRLDHDPAARHLAETTLAAAERGAALTRRLLAFARRETLVTERVQPNRLVAGILPLLVRTLGEDIEIATDLGAEVWDLEVDPNQLENCLINLAVNARDALPDGGHVTIATRCRVIAPGGGTDGTGPGNVAGESLPAGDYVEIEVSDDGEGMSPEVQERAFEPFFTTKDVGKGSGLGLSMVYGFVRQSGGQVEIDSSVGGGTRLRLLLPRAQPLAVGQQPGQAREGSGAGRGERLLVVEDDAAVRELMAGLLRDQGYGVVEARDGPQALQVAVEAGALDLLVTDMVMPGGMNGAALAQRLRERLPGLPALYVSGYSDRPLPGHAAEPDSTAPVSRPVDRNLAKPFTRQSLARAVRLTLDAAQRDIAAG